MLVGGRVVDPPQGRDAIIEFYNNRTNWDTNFWVLLRDIQLT
jgi:hypothetical protein